MLGKTRKDIGKRRKEHGISPLSGNGNASSGLPWQNKRPVPFHGGSEINHDAVWQTATCCFIDLCRSARKSL